MQSKLTTTLGIYINRGQKFIGFWMNIFKN